MKALVRSSVWIQIFALTAAVLTITTTYWFAICDLTRAWLDLSSHAVLFMLILLVSATTSGLMLLVLSRKVFQPLRLIRQYNLKQASECTADDCTVMLIPEEFIPAGEIGELMRSRNKMLEHLARMLREIQQSYDKIRELEKLKESLTQMIVHDLKNPLGVILLGMDILARNANLSTEYKELVEHARTSGQQMLTMIQNLLDISKMEEGKLQLNFSQVDLKMIAAEIFETAKTNYLAEGKVLKLSIEPNLPVFNADEDLLRRVVQNLLSNALKHTSRSGCVELQIKQVKNSSVRIAVTDDGMGIAKEDQSRIFDKFEQGGLRDAKHRTGSGLGLTFCRLAVEAHGGRIWVESELGRGSTFFIEFPVAEKNNHRKQEEVGISKIQQAGITTVC